MFEKLIGISFLSLASDILLSKSSFKKYIKAIIGAMFVLTVISGISKAGEFKIDIPDYDISNVEENREIFMEDLNSRIVLNTEQAIKDKLSDENIKFSYISIDFNEDYRIKNIRICLEDYSKDKDAAIELLVNYFKIDKEVISLCRG